MAFPNHLSQEMALHHYSEQHLGENSSENHHQAQPPTWLNSAILRQQPPYPGGGGGGGGGEGGNFLNLHTSTEASANQWLSRSILQRNVSDVRDDVMASSGDMGNRDEMNVEGGNGGGEMAGGKDGILNWQSTRYKAEILGHPLYEQLLSAHVACLRIATPVD